MSTLQQYLLVFLGSLILVMLLVSIAAVFAPKIFLLGVEQGEQEASATGSPTRGTVGEMLASVAPLTEQVEAAISDSLDRIRREVSMLGDSVRTLASQLERERQKATQLSLQAQRPTVEAETGKLKDVKDVAKYLESMSVENAASVLKRMPDSEVRQILQNMKKRQAAKILSALEPERVANLLK